MSAGANDECSFDEPSLYWGLLGALLISASDHTDVIARMHDVTAVHNGDSAEVRTRPAHHLIYVVPRLVAAVFFGLAIMDRDMDTLAIVSFFGAVALGYVFYAANALNLYGRLDTLLPGGSKLWPILMTVALSVLYVLAVTGFTYELQNDHDDTFKMLARWATPSAFLLDLFQFWVRHRDGALVTNVSFALHLIQATVWPCVAFVISHSCE